MESSKQQYGASVGSRLYLLDDRSDSRYKIFHLKNREFTMDVVSMHAECTFSSR